MSARSARPAVETGARPAVRLEWVDALRGVAIVLMIAYHLSFDLGYFRVLRADFNHDPFWLTSRSVIVSMFLALVGISLVLAQGREFALRLFLTRELRIGGCAVLVSAGSYLMFPATFIYFGILHFIFVASLIGTALLRTRLPAMAYAIAGAIAIYAAVQYTSPVFDSPPLTCVGFMTHKPYTEDYVPLFPWIGVVLLGIAAGKLWLARQAGLHPVTPTPAPTRTASLPLRASAWLGRHSLPIYMLHQPLLLSILYPMVGR